MILYVISNFMENLLSKSNIFYFFCMCFIFINSLFALYISNRIQVAFSQGYIPSPPPPPSQNNIQSLSQQQQQLKPLAQEQLQSPQP